jgi:single-strand DNA-binding protein
MSRSINKVILVGNVAGDPEVRHTAGGSKYAKFSLATNNRVKGRDGEWQDKAQFHRCTAWEKLADLVEEYVKKGDRLYIEGRLEYSQSEDQNGVVRHWTDIVVRELVMLGSPAATKSQSGQARTMNEPPHRGPGNAPPPPAPFDAEDDDLPF